MNVSITDPIRNGNVKKRLSTRYATMTDKTPKRHWNIAPAGMHRPLLLKNDSINRNKSKRTNVQLRWCVEESRPICACRHFNGSIRGGSRFIYR